MERKHLFHLAFLAILFTTVSPASAASCEPNPCGQGAECQSMSTIAVCLCPPGTSGDPFESCQPTSVTATSGSSSVSSSTESSSMSTSTLASPSSSSSAASYSTMPSTSMRSVPMTKPSEMTTRYTTDYAMSTPQESRHTHAYTTPGHQRSSVPMLDNGGYGYRTTYNDDSYRHRPTNYHNSYNNEPMRGQDRHHYHKETSPQYNSHAVTNIMMTDRPSYRHRDRDSYYQDSGNQEYMRRVVSVPETNYDRVYDERYADSSRDYVKDPMGVYSNCKTVNGILVCADTKDQQNMADSPQQDSMYKSGSTSNNYYYESRPRDEEIYRPQPMPSSSSSSYHGRDRDRDDMYMPQQPMSSSSSYHDGSMRNRNKYRDDIPSSTYVDTQPKPMRSQPHGRNPGDIVHEFVIKSPDTPSYLETTPPQNTRPYHQQSETVTPGSGDPDQCRQFCGENSICRQIRGRPICGCPEGYTGDASVRCEPAEDQLRMKNRCEKHTDCSDKEICDESQCIDPCSIGMGASEDRNELRSSHSYRRSKQSSFYDAPRRGEITAAPTAAAKKTRKNFCGPNTKCHVIDHTPLCGCLDGFTGNPYTRCVRSG